ncbi:TPA: hypothetical protein ACI7F5_004911, partial [Escherichia coli]
KTPFCYLQKTQSGIDRLSQSGTEPSKAINGPVTDVLTDVIIFIIFFLEIRTDNLFSHLSNLHLRKNRAFL